MSSEDGKEGLWLRNVPTNSNTQVVPAEPVHYMGLRFSADGNYLYFARSETGSQELDFLYRAPVLGGTPQKLITDIDSNITFSPDGRQYAYIVLNNPPNTYRLVIHSLEGNDQKDLATGPRGNALYEPTWSPDGKTIVCFVAQPGNALTGLVAVDVASGQQRVFFSAPLLSSLVLSGCPTAAACSPSPKIKPSNFTRAADHLRLLPRRQVDSSHPRRQQLLRPQYLLQTAALWSAFSTKVNGICSSPTATAAGEPQQVSTGSPIRGFTWTRDNNLIVDQQYMLSQLDPHPDQKPRSWPNKAPCPASPIPALTAT